MMRAIVGSIVMVFTCGGAYGQSADAMTTFEVASVKPSAPPVAGMPMRVGGTGGPGTKDPTRIAYQNMSLSNLVTMAYDLKRYQYSGPSWLDTERFDVTAKIPEGATKEQFRLMMQNLLAERFKLVVHHEQKEMPGYQLVVAKNGPKLKETVEDPAAKDSGPNGPLPPLGGPPKLTLDKEGFPMMPAGRGGSIMMNGRARMQFFGQTLEQFAAVMANQVGKPVTDATGLKGKYDFSIYYVSEGMMGAPPPPPPPGMVTPPAASNPEETGPNIYNALQEQLGLRLEAKKTSVDMVVVDRCEKVPTEN